MTFFDRFKKESSKTHLRRYIYLSESKVDRLFGQIDSSLVRQLSGELKFNFGFVSTTFKQDRTEEHLTQRLAIVERYIEENFSIGTVDAPTDYFRDTRELCWGPLESLHSPEEANEFPPVVYFGGSTDRTILGLGGSSYHLVGYRGDAKFTGASLAPFLIRALKSSFEAREQDSVIQYYDELDISAEDTTTEALMYIAFEAKYDFGPMQEVDFLAEKLLIGELEGRQVLLGSPLYVAYA